MKKIIALVTVLTFAVPFIALSQNKKPADDKGKMHIKIEVEKDGKTTKIDTIINPEELAAFNEKLKEMNIYVAAPGNSAEVNAYAFATDPERLKEEIAELEKQMKDGKFNMEEFEKQMQLLEERLNDSTSMFSYKFNTGDSLQLIELENSLGNMNFNFSNDDNGVKTIIIDGDNINIDGQDIKIGGNEGGKKIIIKKEAAKPDKKDSKKNSKQKKETQKVIIIMKSSTALPEKQKAEFAAEPVKDTNKTEPENSARIRPVDKKDNAWLNELTCYPNPSSGQFTVSFRLSNPEPAELKVMDIAGREVFAENIPENSEWVEKQIKLPANSSAAYLLILRQGTNWYHEKIFVKS